MVPAATASGRTTARGGFSAAPAGRPAAATTATWRPTAATATTGRSAAAAPTVTWAAVARPLTATAARPTAPSRRLPAHRLLALRGSSRRLIGPSATGLG